MHWFSDFLPDDEAAKALQQRRTSSRGATTSDRTQLRSPIDICNIPGMLELPTSFGSLFLGEVQFFKTQCTNLSRRFYLLKGIGSYTKCAHASLDAPKIVVLMQDLGES